VPDERDPFWRPGDVPLELVGNVDALRAWFEAARTSSQHVRGPERRQGDRRARGFASRRADDRERNRQCRTFLLAYLQQLPPATLWLWIDGLWLGCANDAQLVALMECARASGTLRPVAPLPSRGRPPTRELLPTVPWQQNAWVRSEWRRLHREFSEGFGQFRRKHHARMNRTRRGGFRTREFRDACLVSPIGQDVQRAGLFEEFFDTTRRTPQQMAARLLHRQTESHLTEFETDARARAVSAPSPESRALYQTWAEQAAGKRRALGTWTTLYDALTKPKR